MKNRAKCRLCGTIIESKSQHDYVSCPCGEIAVDGGDDYHRVFSRNWENFIRVDDEGNEIIPKIVEAEENVKESPVEEKKPITRVELLEMLDQMIDSTERLPIHGKMQPITQYDLLSVLLLMRHILKNPS